MPNYKYGDSDNVLLFVELGDYVVEINDVAFGLSKQGNDKIDLKLKVEKTGTTVYDVLTFSEKAFWRIDTCLKSCGVKIAKGEDAEFNKERLKEGQRYIKLIGLRGWVTLGVEEYPVGSGKKKNKVLTWLTDKEKLAPSEANTVAEEDEVQF
jgi:hypothetical protein